MLLALGCSEVPERPRDGVPAKAADEPKPSAPPVQEEPAPKGVNVPDEPAAPLVRGDLKELLGRLRYKPDPYGPGPDCVSEARSTVRDELLLTMRMRLTRADDGALRVVEPAYQVSESRVGEFSDTQASLGIPRLELVRSDGQVLGRDFRGQYREPGASDMFHTSEVAPRDPTWVEAWFASVPIDKGVDAYRVTLDGQVLYEVKRPKKAPALSSIDCAEPDAAGIKLSWRSQPGDGTAPFLVDVLRHGPLGFVEELPMSDARKVKSITVRAPTRGELRDAVLLVSVTDTFHLVSRGVLVPKAAL